MSIQQGFTVDLLRLVDQLKQLAEQPKVLPFLGISLGYNKEEMVMQIEKLRASMPRDIRDASGIQREAERRADELRTDAATLLEQANAEATRVREEARKEAETMLEQARLKQEIMISESEVLKLAKAQSDEIRTAAQKDSTQMRRGADEYAYETMRKLGDRVSHLMSTIERYRSELEPNNGGKDRLKV